MILFRQLCELAVKVRWKAESKMRVFGHAAPLTQNGVDRNSAKWHKATALKNDAP
jgi:hypothetical protein